MFQPSRCLHKGILPTSLDTSFQSRKVLHLSFMIAPHELLPENLITTKVESAILSIKQTSALPPFLLKTYSYQ